MIEGPCDQNDECSASIRPLSLAVSHDLTIIKYFGDEKNEKTNIRFVVLGNDMAETLR